MSGIRTQASTIASSAFPLSNLTSTRGEMCIGVRGSYECRSSLYTEENEL